MLAAVIIIAAVLSAVLAGLFAAYYKVFYYPYKGTPETGEELLISNRAFHDEIRDRTQALSARECEFFTTRARDGVTLSARYYHRGDDLPLCICFHGYHGAAVRDFSMMAPFLYDSGHNVLLVDQRAHGRSGGHTIAYGVRERYDVLTWVSFANERFGSGRPAYLFGISMGAATVLMASGLDLPENVRAICADCPYSSPKDIIRHVSASLGLNPSLCWPIIRLSALLYGRLNINATTAADAVRHTKKPILIIHGESDHFVPADMSEQVQRANPSLVERHTFPCAEHGLSYLCDPDRYKRIVLDFLERHP